MPALRHHESRMAQSKSVGGRLRSSCARSADGKVGTKRASSACPLCSQCKSECEHSRGWVEQQRAKLWNGWRKEIRNSSLSR
eukprot:787527-Pleurochrysis_carterae.AAC.2